MGRALAATLQKRLTRYDRARERMEALNTKGKLSQRDLEAAFAGLFIGSITSFEVFLQALFEKTVLGRAHFAPRRAVRSRLTIGDAGTLGELLLVETNRKYVDWLPIQNTLKRAEVFLVGGRPFSDITEKDKGALSNFMTIRNALAHMSDNALKKFITEIAIPAQLPPRLRTPAAYLTSRISPPTGLTRLAVIIRELNAIGRTIT
jgi:hypothetical protein